ncbi:YdeI/OmpD-associated family protein [Paenibacillus sp. UNC451MF]|uniref:YdeI/OmpD-associated family protein n=1 Tax=Paenibacillus sp. UNC451MF TaxID=1449063 RepID=UPI00055C41DF|nr:YdeI/OmpD-associated family protein [Paenibacillus sp. UNC451MF]
MDNDLVKKLRMQSGQRVLIMNAPDGFIERVTPLPDQAKLDQQPSGEYDFVQLFITSVDELNALGPDAIKAVKQDGLLWISYPKKSSKIKTDLNRDSGWDIINEAGFEGIALISIDATWSAMRFRPADLVRSTSSRREHRSIKTESSEPRERIVEVPEYFQILLDGKPEVKSFFDGLSYTHRKEYVRWITEAKREETRSSRIEKSLEKLAAGIKSPFIKP